MNNCVNILFVRSNFSKVRNVLMLLFICTCSFIPNTLFANDPNDKINNLVAQLDTLIEQNAINNRNGEYEKNWYIVFDDDQSGIKYGNYPFIDKNKSSLEEINNAIVEFNNDAALGCEFYINISSIVKTNNNNDLSSILTGTLQNPEDVLELLKDKNDVDDIVDIKSKHAEETTKLYKLSKLDKEKGALLSVLGELEYKNNRSGNPKLSIQYHKAYALGSILLSAFSEIKDQISTNEEETEFSKDKYGALKTYTEISIEAFKLAVKSHEIGNTDVGLFVKKVLEITKDSLGIDKSLEYLLAAQNELSSIIETNNYSANLVKGKGSAYFNEGLSKYFVVPNNSIPDNYDVIDKKETFESIIAKLFWIDYELSEKKDIKNEIDDHLEDGNITYGKLITNVENKIYNITEDEDTVEETDDTDESQEEERQFVVELSSIINNALNKVLNEIDTESDEPFVNIKKEIESTDKDEKIEAIVNYITESIINNILKEDDKSE